MKLTWSKHQSTGKVSTSAFYLGGVTSYFFYRKMANGSFALILSQGNPLSYQELVLADCNSERDAEARAQSIADQLRISPSPHAKYKARRYPNNGEFVYRVEHEIEHGFWKAAPGTDLHYVSRETAVDVAKKHTEKTGEDTRVVRVISPVADIISVVSGD